jgi:hypothetical protein
MHPKRLRSAVDLHRCTDVGNLLQECQKVPKSASRNWASEARHGICKSQKHRYIGDRPCVFQRCKTVAPPRTLKLALWNRGVVHYGWRRVGGRESGRRTEGGGRESGIRVRALAGVRVRARLKIFSIHIGRTHLSCKCATRKHWLIRFLAWICVFPRI